MKPIVVSLFDLTGVMVLPWLDAGYECWIVDTQHPPAYDNGGITQDGDLYRVYYDLSRPWLPPFDRERIAFVAAFPPCDHLAVSGARWFKGKGLRKLAESINLFASAVEFCEWSGAKYIAENPRSTISTYWRKPDHSFSPHQFTGYTLKDNYTKDTFLWTGGGFQMPEYYTHPQVQRAIETVMIEFGRMVGKPKVRERFFDNEFLEQWYPDDRIHKCAPGPDRANKRSGTPVGFSRAVFDANHEMRAVA